MKIAIIDDNRNLARAIARVLRQNHFSVEIFFDGISAENFLRSHFSEISKNVFCK